MPTVSTDGATLHYAVAGSGPTVVFCNDAVFGVWQWAFQQPAIAGPFETLAFDYRGTGESTGGPISTPSAFVADLERVLADHGARRVHLVGAGLGGMVALEYARRHGRAKSLVLFGTPSTGERIDDTALAQLASADASALDPCLDRERLSTADDVRSQIERWRDSDDATGAVRDGQLTAMQSYALERPYEIDQPALLIHGRDDPVVPLAAGRRLAESLPRGSFEPIAGKHLARIDAAAPANDLLVGFLESVTEE